MRFETLPGEQAQVDWGHFGFIEHQGRRRSGHSRRGRSGEELAKLFAAIYQQIEERPEDPDADREQLADTVQRIEEEAAKGVEARPKKVERWLRFLGSMPPDIPEVTAAALANPVAGAVTAIRKIAEKAKAEADAGSV